MIRDFSHATNTLPYNQHFVDYLRRQKLEGRRPVLATAADHQIAHGVADHLGVFDVVIASDGVLNLKAGAKDQNAF